MWPCRRTDAAPPALWQRRSRAGLGADGRSIFIAGPSELQRLDVINIKARLTVPGVPAAAGRLQLGAVQALPRPSGFEAIQDLQVDGRGRQICAQSVHTGLWMVADAALNEDLEKLEADPAEKPFVDNYAAALQKLFGG